MVNIYLIRHAQSIGNIEQRLTGLVDYPLTRIGEEQVEKLTDYLKDISFCASYSSPSRRAINTIKPVAQKNHLDVQTVKELSEMYFGIYDGFKWDEVNQLNPLIHQKHLETNEIMEIPEQESTEQVAERMYQVISKIADQNKEGNILIASHGVAIEAFLRKITKEPFIQKREEYSQKNTSVNIVQYDKKRKEYCVKVLNSMEHLNSIKLEEDLGR